MAAKRILRKIVWWVYLARCSDATLYCGVTTDLDRRFDEHNHALKGARYTRSRRPVEMVWSQKQKTRSAALKREYAVKQLSRREKEALVAKRSASLLKGVEKNARQ